MLLTRRLRALLTALLLLTLSNAKAQTGWKQLYTSPNSLSCKKAFRQPDGGFLLIGAESINGFTSASRLYILRTDEHGRQQWDRRIDLPRTDFSIIDGCQNGQGELLLVLSVGTGVLKPNYLVQLSPKGPVRWIRDYTTGAVSPSALAADEAHQGFAVALRTTVGAEVLFLNLDGTTRLQVPVGPFAPAARTSIDAMKAEDGTLTLATNTYYPATPLARDARLVQLSDMGVRGREVRQPVNLELITRFLPLGDGNYLTYATSYTRLSMSSTSLFWNQQVTTNRGYLVPNAWAVNGAGDVLIYGFSMQNSHTATKHLTLISTIDGTIRQVGGQPAVMQLGDQISAGISPAVPTVADIFAGDEPGTFYMAGSAPEGAFLVYGTFAELNPTLTASMQAWPNPLTGDDLLHVDSQFSTVHPLRLYDTAGHQVAEWAPVAGGTAQVSLRGVQPGSYVLVGTNGQGRTQRLHLLKQ